jgi:hypothetical protein
MIDITDSFLRTLEFRLGECSSYAQFSEFYVKNKSILYNEQAFELFTARLNAIKRSCDDKPTRKMCDDLFDDMEDEHSISYVSDSKGKLPILLQFNSEEGRVYRDAITEILKSVYIKTKGKKKEVCRVLGVDATMVEQLIDADKERKRIIADLKKSFKVIKE